MPDAAGRRPADAVARAARQVDADDAIARTARPVARRIGRTEDGDDRRADRYRKMHRTRVARDEQIETLQDRRQHCQVDVARHVDHRAVGQPRSHRLDQRTILRRPGQDDRRARRRDQLTRDVGEALGLPLLDRPAGTDVQPDERTVAGSSQAPRRVAAHVVAETERRGFTIGRAATDDAGDQPARIVGRVCARIVRERDDPAPHRRRRWRNRSSNAAPEAASSRLLRMSGSKLIARSY